MITIQEVIQFLFGIQHTLTKEMNNKQQNEIFWLMRKLRKEKDFYERKQIENKIIEKELKAKIKKVN